MVTLVPRELHTSDRSSSTAQWTTLGRTLELGRDDAHRIVTDCYAPVFLNRAGSTLIRPLRGAAPVVRRLERIGLAGISASVLCRHAFIDTALISALPDVEQVLILGAGYDARAWRFADEIGARPVYEVDLAPLSRRKAAVVRRNSALFGHASVERVEIDFRTQSLDERLADAGFVAGAPTFVAWEGVSMYLPRAAVHATLASLSTVCGSGSVLAMDFWQHLAGRSPYARVRSLGEQALRLVGEPLDFCIPAGQVDGLFTAHEFTVTDRAEPAELTTRFATDGRHCDASIYVVSARLR